MILDTALLLHVHKRSTKRNHTIA